MIFLYYLLAILSAGLMFAFLYCLRDKDIFKKYNNRRLAVTVYGVVFFVRFMGGDFKIQSTVGLNNYSPFGAQGTLATLVSAIVIWLIFAVQLALVLYPFFEREIPRLAPIVRYITPAVYLVAFAILPLLLRAHDGELAEQFHYRLLMLSLEIGLGLAISVFEFVRTAGKRQTRKEWITTVLAFLGMLAITMPCWIPQCIIGYGDSSIIVNDFNIYHRLVLYGSLLFVFPVHFIFSRCNYEQRRYALIFISMATMISYSYKYDFSTFFNVASWPLHLCNTAMFIIPIVLIFRLDKLYYFTLFINVLGAFLAMIMPSIDGENILSSRAVEFWVNHYMAMLLPLLIMSLRIFERPKMRQFIYSLVAFFCYYVIVLFANSYFTALGDTVDFFFINSDFVASKLGKWAEDLRNITLTIKLGELNCIIYPVYQLLYFIVYIIMSFAMWFVYEQVFEITDVYAIMIERNRKIKADRLALEVHLAGRSMQEPMNKENEGKLILRHFSKRYSTSDVYAVYDANLEIEGGQIFGFLGPNGAGKSTIIKSIVGIQTITSGEIEVSGYDVDKQAVGAKMQIGFVPDHYALYENLTGREYINYIADLYNVSKEDRDKRIADYVERFRLEGAIDNPMKTYSHGMKQKITIMSALVHEPKLWILDEPLTGLDPESIFQVKECMKEHAAKGNIVFFSTHIIDVVERICDRIAIIRKGQILCQKTVKEIEDMGIPLEEFYMSTIDGNTQAPVSLKEAADRMSARGAAV